MNHRLFTFFLCYLSFYSHCAQEMRCSKSSYEEELLERLVRVEFAAKRRLEGVRDVENRVKEELNKLTVERETFKRERSDFEDRMKEAEETIANKLSELSIQMQNLTTKTTSDLVSIKNDVVENIKHSEDVITNITSDLVVLKNETIKEIQDSAHRPTILFRARDLVDTNPGNKQKLVFQTVLENHGGAYDRDTGVFRAPMGGEYIFSVQLCSFLTEDFIFSFMQDGIAKQRLEFHQGSGGCGTALYFTQAKLGTEIWIESKFYHNDYNENTLHSDTYRWNVFSGILIK